MKDAITSEQRHVKSADVGTNLKADVGSGEVRIESDIFGFSVVAEFAAVASVDPPNSRLRQLTEPVTQ